jgi:hypothetical protein
MYIDRQQEQYIQFISTINNTNFTDTPYRDIFDSAVDFNYSGNPIEFKSQDKLNRLMVNTIRHSFTNYDDNLRVIHRLKTVPNAYYRYKNSVLTSIAMKYPFLEEECNNQKRKMLMVKVVEKSTT